MLKVAPQGKWQYVAFFLTASLVVAADQLTKIWIRSNLAVGGSLFEIGLFRLTHIHNTGAAFGLFQSYSFILTIVAIVGIAVVLLFGLFFLHQFSFLDNRLIRLTLGLILGGTVGNLIDRISLGYVTDFIDFTVWPAFNIADSAIVVGVILFAYSLLFLTRTQRTDSSV
ncbi:signal peptidase II [Chloroflexota bacterium]